MNNYFEVLKRSFQLLNLDNDWNDEGGLKLKEEVFASSLKLLSDLYLRIDNIITPEIDLCNDGTIDISFRNEKFRLLINISSTINWYGDDKNNEMKTKHTMHDLDYLINWMKNMINEN